MRAPVNSRPGKDAAPDVTVSAIRLKLYKNSTRRLSRMVELATDQSGDIGAAHAWVRFLRRTVQRSCVAPIDCLGQMVSHPLFLLNHKWMLCGQVARLVVDGLATLGVPARVLQLNGHVSAEYFSDGRWVFAEADLFNVAQEVKDDEGNFAGLDSREFSTRLEESLEPYSRSTCHNLRGISEGDWSRHSTLELRDYWSRILRHVDYEVSGERVMTTPYTFSKVGSPRCWDRSRFYGWEDIVYRARD